MSGLIFELIPKVMGDVGSVSKEGHNKQQGYAFRGIEQMYAAVHPAMVKHGIFCAPEVLERDEYRFEKTNFEGKATAWIHVVVKVRHRFYATDGSFVDVTTIGEGLDNSDKASNKSLSGAMKYALIELFCVPTIDIADSDRDTPETGTKKKVVIERPVKVPEVTTVGSGFTILKTAEFVRPADAELKQTVVKADDEDPFATKYITVQQSGKLAQRFRESLREELKPMAETLRHDFLTFEKFIDASGNPSSLMIPVERYIEVGKRAVAYAKGL